MDPEWTSRDGPSLGNLTTRCGSMPAMTPVQDQFNISA